MEQSDGAGSDEGAWFHWALGFPPLPVRAADTHQPRALEEMEEDAHGAFSRQIPGRLSGFVRTLCMGSGKLSFEYPLLPSGDYYLFITPLISGLLERII